MRSAAAPWLVAACVVLASVTVAHAAPENGLEAQEPTKSRDIMDVRVPIPSYSKDVANNGCQVRRDAHAIFVGPDADMQHVTFSELISDTVGGYSVRAILDKPAKLTASLASLDADTRTLVLLDVLRRGTGRDGLHTFFFMSTGQHAPAILDALLAAGLKHEHEVFARAMALFGPTFPVDNDERAKLFSYSSLDTPLNAFDKKMMEVSRSFGTQEAFDKAVVAYVEHTPALWQRVEAKRAQLGEVARLRHLNDALNTRAAAWNVPDAQLGKHLAAMPKEQRTLLAMHTFNGEFENGGVHQFFLNSSGALAPDVYAAFIEMGLDRQAAIFKRGLDMFGANYPRDTTRRRDRFFDHGDWSEWDKKLSGLTDEFYALDGGPTVLQVGGSAAIEGGPGIWTAMAAYARNKKMLPC